MSPLPPLELPALNLAEALSFEIPSDYTWVTATSFSSLQQKEGTANDEEPASPLTLADQLKLPAGTEFISHYECEEASGFGADLLWGYITEQKGGSFSNPTSTTTASPTKSAAGGGNVHQQRGGKKAPQPKQASIRGELSSNAVGSQIVKMGAEDYETDWYEILAIEDESCNEVELKAAFRKRCLDTHPDKHQGSDEEFKQVQRAYEILSHPDARRQFDSSRDFDDSIPPADMNFDDKPADFFGMFKPAFQRNERWSTVPVQVSIGDENTPVADVRKFYDFWMSFRSWRDFSHTAELEEIHNDMARYEKRHYTQENDRILNGLKKQEAKRIRSLVDRAMESDPRLRGEIRRQEEEREAAAEARREAAAEIHREKGRQEREAKEKERIAAQEAKDAAERQRLVWRDAKQSVMDKITKNGLLRADSATKGLLDDGVNIANIDWIFTKIGQAKSPEVIAEKITNVEDEDIVSNFNTVITALERSLLMTRYGEPMSKKAAADSEEKAKAAEEKRNASKKSAAAIAAETGSTNAGTWNEADIVELTKAIAKYPGGTVDRWRKIAQMLRDKFTEDQILIKTKQLEHTSKSGGAGAVLTQVTSAPVPAVEDWTPAQQTQLEDGIRQLKDYKERDKWVKVGEFVTGKNGKQCFERYKHLCAVALKAKKQ